jgi:hypothetical protein
MRESTHPTDPLPPSTLNYSRSADRHPRLRRAANLLLGTPLLAYVPLYSEWVSAWVVLGHRPRPTFDDPKYIMHTWLTSLIIHGAGAITLPAIIAAIVVTILHCRNNRVSVNEMITRAGIFSTPFFAYFGLFFFDPGRVFEWLLD